MNGFCITELRGSSGRGGRGRTLDDGESLALLPLFDAHVSVCWSIPKNPPDAILGSWVTWMIPVSPSGDNGGSTVGRLASFGGEVSLAGANSVGTGMSILSVGD